MSKDIKLDPKDAEFIVLTKCPCGRSKSDVAPLDGEAHICGTCNDTGRRVLLLTLKEFLESMKAIIPESNTLSQEHQELDLEWKDLP